MAPSIYIKSFILLEIREHIFQGLIASHIGLNFKTLDAMFFQVFYLELYHFFVLLKTVLLDFPLYLCPFDGRRGFKWRSKNAFMPPLF